MEFIGLISDTVVSFDIRHTIKLFPGNFRQKRQNRAGVLGRNVKSMATVSLLLKFTIHEDNRDDLWDISPEFQIRREFQAEMSCDWQKSAGYSMYYTTGYRDDFWKKLPEHKK